MAVNQYVYADQLFRRTVIAETELHLKGTYADAGTYVPRDAVDFEGAKYVALIGVSGTAPYGNHSDFWSSLSLITPQPIPTPGGGGIPGNLGNQGRKAVEFRLRPDIGNQFDHQVLAVKIARKIEQMGFQQRLGALRQFVSGER